MTIKEYQEQAHSFSFYSVPEIIEHHGSITHSTSCAYVYACLGLSEESGELNGKLAKIIRDKKGKITNEDLKEISKEIGDTCWMIAEICTVLGLDLDIVMQQNIQKLTDRKNRNVLSGSGDNR